MTEGTCGTHNMPPLRPELQTAHDDMDSNADYFAYAVGRTYDGQAWEVNIRKGNLYFALDGRFIDKDEATAVGTAWLKEQLEREPDADEMEFRQLWQEP